MTVGGKKHSNLHIAICPLKKSQYGKSPEMKAALAKYPNSEALILQADLTAPHLRATGQVSVRAGPFDLDGPLIMAPKAADASIIHLGGPLAVTFYSQVPTIRRERSTELVTMVGSPGLGTGTFVMLDYEDVIPASAHLTAEVIYPPVKPGSPPTKTLYELEKRC